MRNLNCGYVTGGCGMRRTVPMVRRYRRPGAGGDIARALDAFLNAAAARPRRMTRRYSPRSYPAWSWSSSWPWSHHGSSSSWSYGTSYRCSSTSASGSSSGIRVDAKQLFEVLGVVIRVVVVRVLVLGIAVGVRHDCEFCIP
jgi:hypothetical protein